MACPRCPLERIVRLRLGTDISASADRRTCSGVRESIPKYERSQEGSRDKARGRRPAYPRQAPTPTARELPHQLGACRPTHQERAKQLARQRSTEPTGLPATPQTISRKTQPTISCGQASTKVRGALHQVDSRRTKRRKHCTATAMPTPNLTPR